MSKTILLALVASAVEGFAPEQRRGGIRTVLQSERAPSWSEAEGGGPRAPNPQSGAEAFRDLVALQNSIPGPPGFYDPLGLAEMEMKLGWSEGNDYQGRTQAETIGFLRHSEIKHGRVAMAAFLGFIAQCTPLVSGEHSPILPYKDYVANVGPQAQWDNIPLFGKLQIITMVGMLESYGEGAGQPDGYVHYMKGGKPGFYPEIYGRGGPDTAAGPGRQIPLNLWDPFNWAKAGTAEDRAKGLQCEILNGRAAMFGIMGLLAESSVPGSVPFINAIAGDNYPRYSGNVMVPFSSDFTWATFSGLDGLADIAASSS